MRIELHQITRSGFYARGVDRALFGALRDWHADFHNWVQSRKNVSQTLTFLLDGLIEALLPIAELRAAKSLRLKRRENRK